MSRGMVQAEWLKLRRRSATRTVGVLWPAFILLVYGLLYVGAPDVPARGTAAQHAAAFAPLYPAHLLAVLLPSPISLVGGVMLVLLGAVASGSEYEWQTLKTLLTQGPSRGTILAAKLLALGLVVVLFVGEGLLAAGVGSSVVAVLEHQPLAAPPPGDLLRGAGVLLLMGALWTALGFWLGILCRGAALAVGVGVLYPLIVETLIAAQARQSALLTAIATALPGVNAAALGSTFGALFHGRNAFVAVGAGQATVILAAYVVVFVVLSLASLRRQEVA